MWENSNGKSRLKFQYLFITLYLYYICILYYNWANFDRKKKQNKNKILTGVSGSWDKEISTKSSAQVLCKAFLAFLGGSTF